MRTTLLYLLLLPLFTQAQTNSSLRARSKAILQRLLDNGDLPSDAQDTLIDLNHDGYKDVLIEYYGRSGTGIKNRVMAFLYDPRSKRFQECPELSDLANPTFYFKEKIITGYYIGNGGGYAAKLKWQGRSLLRVEVIDVDISQPNGVFTCTLQITNYMGCRKSTRVCDRICLPEEYRYGQYLAVIKNKE